MTLDRDSDHTLPPRSAPSRREFLALAGSVGVQLALMSAGTRPSWGVESPKIVAQEAWARIEQLTEGVWAVVSTPLANNDWTTLSNGGIIAGSDRVVAVEAYGREIRGGPPVPRCRPGSPCGA